MGATYVIENFLVAVLRSKMKPVKSVFSVQFIYVSICKTLCQYVISVRIINELFCVLSSH